MSTDSGVSVCVCVPAVSSVLLARQHRNHRTGIGGRPREKKRVEYRKDGVHFCVFRVGIWAEVGSFAQT